MEVLHDCSQLSNSSVQSFEVSIDSNAGIINKNQYQRPQGLHWGANRYILKKTAGDVSDEL